VQPVADAIGAKLAGIDGLRVFKFVPDDVVPPAAFVAFPTINYDTSNSGDYSATFLVHIIVGRAHARSAYAELSPYLLPTGEKSVRAALIADPTLGGEVGSTRVESASVSPVTIAEQDYLQAVFSVETLLAA
jgi:hypothetical protein